MDIYTNCYVTFDDKILAEAATVRVNKNPNHNVVATLAKGLAGITLGAQQCEITIDSAVPSADFEVNPDPYMQTGRVVNVGVVAANRQMTSKMVVMGGDFTAGVGQSAGLSISLLGPLAAWE